MTLRGETKLSKSNATLSIELLQNGDVNEYIEMCHFGFSAAALMIYGIRLHFIKIGN